MHNQFKQNLTAFRGLPGLPDARRSATAHFPWQLHAPGTACRQLLGTRRHYLPSGAAWRHGCLNWHWPHSPAALHFVSFFVFYFNNSVKCPCNVIHDSVTLIFTFLIIIIICFSIILLSPTPQSRLPNNWKASISTVQLFQPATISENATDLRHYWWCLLLSNSVAATRFTTDDKQKTPHKNECLWILKCQHYQYIYLSLLYEHRIALWKNKWMILNLLPIAGSKGTTVSGLGLSALGTEVLLLLVIHCFLGSCIQRWLHPAIRTLEYGRIMY